MKTHILELIACITFYSILGVTLQMDLPDEFDSFYYDQLKHLVTRENNNEGGNPLLANNQTKPSSFHPQTKVSHENLPEAMNLPNTWVDATDDPADLTYVIETEPNESIETEIIDYLETETSDTTETEPTDYTGTEPTDITETEPSDTTETEPSDTTETEPSDSTETEPSDTTETEPTESTEREPTDTTVTEPTGTTETEPSGTTATDSTGTAATEPTGYTSDFTNEWTETSSIQTPSTVVTTTVEPDIPTEPTTTTTSYPQYVLGGPCFDGIYCAVDHSECKSGICTCEVDFVQEGLRSCKNRLLSPCLTDLECLSNSTCAGSVTRTCTCNPSFVATEDLTRCAVRLGFNCTESAECIENAECSSTGECQCQIFHFPVIGGSYCTSLSIVVSPTYFIQLASLLASLVACSLFL